MGAVQLVNPATSEVLRSAIAHNWIVTALAFSPDGKRLASASHDHSIKIWDTATGQETLSLHGHKSSVTSVWFSADGQRLISCDQAGEMRTWDAAPLAP
jgi:WD40 repeat protein